MNEVSMDTLRPLWDLTVVHGLNGNRSGLIFRLHHWRADGIAGDGIMNVLKKEKRVRRENKAASTQTPDPASIALEPLTRSNQKQYLGP